MNHRLVLPLVVLLTSTCASAEYGEPNKAAEALYALYFFVGLMLLVHEKLPSHDFVSEYPQLCWGGFVVGLIAIRAIYF